MEHIDTEDAYADVFGQHPTPGLIGYELQGGYDDEPLTLVVGNEGPGEGYEGLPGFIQSWPGIPALRAADGGPFPPDSEEDCWAPVTDFYAYRVGGQ